MRTHLAALVSLGLLAATGCEGKLSEIIPKDLSAQASDAGDAAMMMMPVDMGPVHFKPDIEASLDSLTCASSATGCHQAPNGNAPKFVYMATMDADIMANYAAFMAESTPTTPGDNTTAPILTNPLNATSQHSGGTLFASTTDPTYQLWLKWINDGELY